jgi:hypothetical protein
LRTRSQAPNAAANRPPIDIMLDMHNVYRA